MYCYYAPARTCWLGDYQKIVKHEIQLYLNKKIPFLRVSYQNNKNESLVVPFCLSQGLFFVTTNAIDEMNEII